MQVAKQHCLDTKISQTHWMRLITNNKLNALVPFSMSATSNTIFYPIGETIYVYSCKKKITKPIDLKTGKCYKNIPVEMVNNDFLPEIKNNVTLFLTAHSRILTNVGIEIPCSSKFHVKYKTLTGNWIAHTKNGVVHTLAPKSKFEYKNEVYITDPTNHTYNFDRDAGLYNFDLIEVFDSMQTFAGERNSVLATITANIASTKGSSGIEDGNINVEDAFPKFPWYALKDKLVDGLSYFEYICSIVVGVQTLFNLGKNIINACIHGIMLKRIGEGLFSTITFFLSPSAYFLNNAPKQKEREERRQYNRTSTP